MHLINFSFTTSYGKCSCCQNEAIWFTVTMKSNISAATEQIKSTRPMKKSCVIRTCCLYWPHGILSINMTPQNLWFKLWLSILIIENILKSTFMRLFTGMRWKINGVTSRSMGKRPRFCTSWYIFGTWGDVVGFK